MGSRPADALRNYGGAQTRGKNKGPRRATQDLSNKLRKGRKGLLTETQESVLTATHVTETMQLFRSKTRAQPCPLAANFEDTLCRKTCHWLLAALQWSSVDFLPEKRDLLWSAAPLKDPRQYIISASDCAKSGLQCHPELVPIQFSQAVMTGQWSGAF